MVVSRAWLCAACCCVRVFGGTVLGQCAHACCGSREARGGGADSCVRLCCGAAENEIGEAGAVALSKALESGNCKLTSLDVYRESGVAVRCMLLCAGVWQDGAWAVRSCMLREPSGEEWRC